MIQINQSISQSIFMSCLCEKSKYRGRGARVKGRTGARAVHGAVDNAAITVLHLSGPAFTVPGPFGPTAVAGWTPRPRRLLGAVDRRRSAGQAWPGLVAGPPTSTTPSGHGVFC